LSESRSPVSAARDRRREAAGLTPHHWKLLALLGVAGFFEQYDLGLFSLALRQIQADLGLSEESLGSLGSIVRLGALPAFFAAWGADRFGRKPLLMLTIAGYTLATGATAFAQDAQTFVALQFLARMFVVAESILAVVVIVEEFPPGQRGFGIGALATLAVLGRAMALILFALIDELPFGWRFLYAVGLAPLVLLIWLRRGLPETRLFSQQAAARRGHALRPVAALVSAYPGRFLLLVSITTLVAFAGAPVDFFFPKFVQESHGWSPAQLSLVGLLAGGIGTAGYLAAGWLIDRFGRKRSVFLFLLLEPVAATAVYSVASDGVPLAYAVFVFNSVGNDVVLAALGSELFATSFRSTAAGARSAAQTLGAAAGLQLETLLFATLGSHVDAVRVIALTAVVAALLVVFLPETGGRALEEVSPERSPPAPERA
jgi:putative MFS transporter